MTPIKNRYCSQCFLFQACVLYSVFTESSFFIRFLYRLLTPAWNNWCVKDISFCRCFLCPSNKSLILTSLKIFSDQDIAKDTLLGIVIGSAHCNDQIIYIFERFTHWFWPQLLLQQKFSGTTTIIIDLGDGTILSPHCDHIYATKYSEKQHQKLRLFLSVFLFLELRSQLNY